MIDRRVNNFQEVQKATNKQLELMKLTWSSINAMHIVQINDINQCDINSPENREIKNSQVSHI